MVVEQPAPNWDLTELKERGRWKIRYYTDQAQPDGSIRRVRKTKCLGSVEAITFREARKAAQRFVEGINDVEPALEHAEKTISDLVAEWRGTVKPMLKLSTQSQYDHWAFRKWVLPELGTVPVSELSRVDVQRFLTRAATKLSGKSVRNLRIALRSLLAAAVEWEWLSTNPAAGRLRLPEAAPVRERRVLTPDQFQELVGNLDEPYATIVGLAVLTGLRKGEIEALRWVDVQAGRLVIDEAVYRGQLGSPNTARSRRNVSIGPSLEEGLGRWRAKAKPSNEREFVFASRNGSPIDLHNVAARRLKPTCLKLGLPKVGRHDLRHTYATWGRRVGVSPEMMRDQLGHSSIRMTLDVYSHVDDRADGAALIESYAMAKSA